MSICPHRGAPPSLASLRLGRRYEGTRTPFHKGKIQPERKKTANHGKDGKIDIGQGDLGHCHSSMNLIPLICIILCLADF